MYFEQFVVSLKRLLLLLGIYSLLRFLFLVFNYQEFSEANFSDILLVFLWGIRFDLSSICLINSPILLLSLLPFSFTIKRNYQLFLRILFLILNIPFIFLNLIDLEFFKFINRRISFNIVGIAGDIGNQSLQLLYNYWYITVLAI